MQAKPVSPAAILWNRLRKNKPAMAGLIIIILAVFISVFCFVLIPDKSPDANTMNLALGTLKPGTTVTILKVPDPVPRDKQSFFHKVLFGEVSSFRQIPVDSYRLTADSIFYREFTGDPSIKGEAKSMHIASLMFGNKLDKISGDKINYFDRNGELHTVTLKELHQLVERKRINIRTFVLGTDRFGRDLLSRIMVGTRVSMAVGLIAVLISLIIGITLGALAGFFRGWVDDVILWLINVVWSIPTLLLVIAITMALGKGFAQVFVAVGLTMWVEVARVVRGQIFSLREMEFVEAGRALGFKNSRIILKHVLPNVLSPVIVIAASNFASAILLEAGLSFLGMGAQPPTPSWGMMIKENYGYIIVDAAYLAVYPGLAIMIMVLAFTWLGNGLRDAVDAREGMGSRV